MPLRCNGNEIIVISSAEYGRMELGRCITEPNEFMGCTNDVLPLIDRWCSGRRECVVGVPNPKLEEFNQNCLKVLIKYLLLKYSCVPGKGDIMQFIICMFIIIIISIVDIIIIIIIIKVLWAFELPVNNDCSSSRSTSLIGAEGMISSSTYDIKGCGSHNSPWIISAQPGQTINISIIDFGTHTESSNLVSCPVVYGYVREGALGINYTICNGHHRERAVYSSKTNKVEIEILPRRIRRDKNFVLKYIGELQKRSSLFKYIYVSFTYLVIGCI